MTPPLVSVVTATYNRSEVLAHALRSVVGQTFRDWELLVIGDRCTDDTAEVVASFADERIRFVNRTENHGEQSVPNNDGVALSRGDLIAFLNHDDLWAPEHLETGLARLEESAADLVYSLRATLHHDRRVTVGGRASVRRGLLRDGLPASTWLMRRELSRRAGPWRSAFDLCLVPSQDWLVRALDLGARVVCTEAVTTVMVPSGRRQGSYLFTDPEDVAAALALLEADRRHRLAMTAPDPHDQLRLRGAAGALRRGLWRVIEPLLLAARIHPYRARMILQGRPRRGALIRRLRRTRGLPAVPERTSNG